MSCQDIFRTFFKIFKIILIFKKLYVIIKPQGDIKYGNGRDYKKATT